jgi:hypothetical protein
MNGEHRAVAVDVWNLIKALCSTEFGTPMALKELDDLDAAAINLIEMACDSAAEAAYPNRTGRPQ